VFVCILPGKAIPEMTYTVSGGTLNPTHSLTHSCAVQVTCTGWPLHIVHLVTHAVDILSSYVYVLTDLFKSLFCYFSAPHFQPTMLLEASCNFWTETENFRQNFNIWLRISDWGNFVSKFFLKWGFSASRIGFSYIQKFKRGIAITFPFSLSHYAIACFIAKTQYFLQRLTCFDSFIRYVSAAYYFRPLGDVVQCFVSQEV